MKRLLITAALAGTMLAAGIPAVAQTTTDSQPSTTQQQPSGKHRHHRDGQRMFARLSKKLNLTQDQQNQLKPILEKQHEQARAIWQDNSLSKDQKKEKMRAIHQETMAQVNNILTPEQQQQWQQMRARHHHEKHGEQPSSTPQGQ